MKGWPLVVQWLGFLAKFLQQPEVGVVERALHVSLDYLLFDSSFVGPSGRNPIACRGCARILHTYLLPLLPTLLGRSDSGTSDSYACPFQQHIRNAGRKHRPWAHLRYSTIVEKRIAPNFSSSSLRSWPALIPQPQMANAPRGGRKVLDPSKRRLVALPEQESRPCRGLSH